ncbi:MAG: HEAT repeat domain-containing protein [Pseudomonadota bacterium]|nr:HEAT repeat domain-containing protein [Pseudomonadota bacterium]
MMLEGVLVVEGTLLAATLALFIGHGLWAQWRGTRRRRLLDRGRGLIAAALQDSPPLDAAGQRWLASLPVRLQIRLFTDAARSVTGTQRQRLTELAQAAGLIARAETRCRSRWWWRRLQGARLLAALGGGEGSVEPLLQDRNPYVRAQAIEWAADHPGPAVIAAVLARLNDAHGLCRFKAQDSLVRMAGPVIEPLARYLLAGGGGSMEAALRVAVGLAEHRFLIPALTLCRDPSAPVRALVATLLGKLGGGQGVEILTVLLADADAGVRAAAARALGQLGHWPAAPALAVLLKDPAWTARREAGLALRAVGAPGILFLRRALTDQDRFAADMARQVLDLPEAVERAWVQSP